ncbi:alpha/beta fold hydrolase [Roseibium sp.]|uniref:alpha/beta fold hydrolase n=1 Tax=Roseibium sp. TaxID=1936156 RepID=UPI003B516C2B
MTWTTRPRSKCAGIASIRQGEGLEVLLIHGVGLRAEAWNAQIDGLCGEFQMVAVDMPGHGESVPLDGPAYLAEFTARIARVLDGPAVIIGHSMGAMIALDLAARTPDLVCGVVALNAIYRRTTEAKRAVQQRSKALSNSGFQDYEPTLARWFGSDQSDARKACEYWLKTTDLQGYSAAYQVFAEEDGPSDDLLQGLSCPAVFMTGGLEPNSTPEMSETMARLAPRGKAQVIADAAHMMPMTHPDQVNKALLDFVRECTT